MEKSLEAYMRFGIVHFMAFPELGGGSGPWEETVQHIALDPFFNAIEITHYGDNHPIFGTPGSANDVHEVVEFLRILLELGILGGEQRPIISFEIKPMDGQDSLVMIANAKRVLKEA